MRALFIAAFLFLSFLSASPLRAQTATDVNEGCRIVQDATTGVFTLSWWGKNARTYFIQHSDDLITWSYFPLIESGAAAVTQYGFTNTNQRGFLRLRHSDAATGGNVETADFDGDHVGNMTELNQTTDPLGWTDADGDQVPGDWEIFHGLNPASAADAILDADEDGLTNRAEFQHNTDPHLKDTDADGFEDGYEVLKGTDPALATSSPLINAQGQIAAVTSLAQTYVDVRAADGSLADRDAAWTALLAAKAALDAELAQLLANTTSPTTLEDIGGAQQQFDDAVAPALAMPSTAVLQCVWVESGFNGKHWITQDRNWTWSPGDPGSWSGDTPVTHEGDEALGGGWTDSDGHSGSNGSVAAAMEPPTEPQQWHDGAEGYMSATGVYDVSEQIGGGIPEQPTYSGGENVETAITSTRGEAFITYTGQYREFKIRRSHDGDQNMPLGVYCVVTNGTSGSGTEVATKALCIPEGGSESTETIAVSSKPTTPNSTQAQTLSAPNPNDIVPDAGMAGVIGDLMPSAKKGSAMKHFVTPQKSADLPQASVDPSVSKAQIA